MQALHFNQICCNCKYWTGTFETKIGICNAINENTYTDKIKISYSPQKPSILVETDRFFGCKLWKQKNKIENWQSLEKNLISAFEARPYENGLAHHEGELILETVMHQGCENYLTDIVLESKKYNMLYDTLSCLVHLDDKPGSLEWRTDFIKTCMNHSDIYVRDPAVGLVEYWDDTDLYEILKNHAEPIEYIKSYIDDILNEKFQDAQV